jgi:hypothetical protein
MQKLQIRDAPSICFISVNSWDAQAAQFGFQVVRLAPGPCKALVLAGRNRL